jgi:hypothetical protein
MPLMQSIRIIPHVVFFYVLSGFVVSWYSFVHRPTCHSLTIADAFVSKGFVLIDNEKR